MVTPAIKASNSRKINQKHEIIKKSLSKSKPAEVTLTDYAAPIMIDGVLCRNCSDVDRVKAAQNLGVDPSRIAPGGGLKPKPDSSTASPSQNTVSQDNTPQRGVNAPLTSGDKGRTINLLT